MRKLRIKMNQEKLKTILRMKEMNKTISEIAMTLDVSETGIYKILRRYNDHIKSGNFIETFFKQAGPCSNTLDSVSINIRRILGEDCTLTQKGMCMKLAESGINRSQASISKKLQKINYTRKVTKRIVEKYNPERRLQKQQYGLQLLDISDEKLLFLDESGFNLHTVNNYGYSLKNHPAVVDSLR